MTRAIVGFLCGCVAAHLARVWAGRQQHYNSASRVEEVKPQEKLIKAREFAEQANVELEVLRNQVSAQQGNEQAAGQGHEGLLAEVQKLKDGLAQKQATYADVDKKLEDMKTNLQNLDQVPPAMPTDPGCYMWLP